jgi:hypothetical protein
MMATDLYRIIHTMLYYMVRWLRRCWVCGIVEIARTVLNLYIFPDIYTRAVQKFECERIIGLIILELSTY